MSSLLLWRQVTLPASPAAQLGFHDSCARVRGHALLDRRVWLSALAGAMCLLGCHPVGPVGGIRHAQASLVAVGVIQKPGLSSYVYLPVAVHGYQTTVLVDLGSTVGVLLNESAMARFDVAEAETLDSLGIGATVEYNIPLSAASFAAAAPNGWPPVAGMLGSLTMSHYDLEFDGQGHRLRVFAFPTSSTMTTGRSAWLPPGLTPADCVLLENDPDGMHRVFLPIKVNGHPITSMFDPGSGSTNINLAAAHVLGITQRTPSVRVLAPGEAGGFSMYQGQRVWEVSRGITLTVGPHILGEVPIQIYQHLPRERNAQDPELSLGLDAVHDRILYVSYSTGTVCISEPRQTAAAVGRSAN